MKNKIFSSFIIVLTISLLFSFPLESEANNAIYSSEYIGTYDADTPMEFYIYTINTVDNTFTEHVNINHQLVTISKDISGTLSLYDNYYTCSFGFTYYWWITNYDAIFDISVDPFTGIATGYGGGGILISSDDIFLTGTTNRLYNKELSYSENDMKMCMSLSKAMYSAKEGKYD